MKQTLTSITIVILGLTNIFVGISTTRLQHRYLRMQNDISRLEKQVELINDMKVGSVKKITPVSGFTYYTVFTDSEGHFCYRAQ